MASSGSFYTSAREGRKLKFSWSVKSKSVENNTTTISWSLTGAGDSGYVKCGDFKVKINNEVVYSSTTRIKVYNTTTIASGTKPIKHNADGTKTLSASVEASIYTLPVDRTGSDSWSLPTIARESKIDKYSISSSLPGNCMITWSAKSESFYHKIKLVRKDWSLTKNVGKAVSGSVNIPADAIPDAYAGTIVAHLYTYTDSNYQNLVGSDSTSFDVRVDRSIRPTAGTITLEPEKISLVDGSTTNLLVQKKNNLKIKVTGFSSGTGSSLKSYKFSGAGISDVITSTSDDDNLVITPFTSAGAKSYTATLTDKRDATATTTEKIQCYEYSKPSFSSFKAYRVVQKTENGNTIYIKDPNGNMVEYCFTPTFSKIENTNNYTVKRTCIDQTTQTKKIDTPREKSTNTSEYVGHFTLDDPSHSYKVSLTITDNYGGTSISSVINILSSERIINIALDGKGVAIGKMVETTERFDSAYTIWGRNNITLKTNNKGYYIANPQGDEEPAIHRNGAGNLWIGGTGTNTSRITGGGTYISAGDSKHIYVNKQNGDIREDYKILDEENYDDFVAPKPIMLYPSSITSGSSPSGTYQSTGGGTTGTAGSITLTNGKTSEFKFLEIFYMDNYSNCRKSTRVFLNYKSGVDAELSYIYPNTDTTSLTATARTSVYTINDSSITWKKGKNITLSDEQPVGVTSVINTGSGTGLSNIKIIGVFGYK